MRTAIVSALLLFSATASASAQEVVERCGVLVRDGEELRLERVPGFTVANATPPFAVPEGYDRIEAVMCGRVSLRFEANDYRVLTDLSVPFNLTSEDGRLIVLEMFEGQFRARMLVGELTAEEARSVQAALNSAQQSEQP